MATRKRSNAGPMSWRRTVKATKKARREAGLEPWDFPSRRKQVWKHTRKKAKTVRANGSSLIPAKLKRMPNGTYKVYVAPGQMLKLRGTNPGDRVYAVGDSQTPAGEGKGMTQSEAVALLKRRPMNGLGMHNYIWKFMGTFAGHPSWKKVKITKR